MTVSDIIEELMKYDPNLTVRSFNPCEYSFDEVYFVKLENKRIDGTCDKEEKFVRIAL